MPRQRGFPHRSRSRRAVTWEQGPLATGLNVTGSTITLGNAGAQLVVAKATLVRLRGHLRLTMSTTNAALAGFRGAFGVAIATAEAFAAGTGSLRAPLSDSDWDGWWFHSFFDIRTITSTIADGVNAVGVIVDMPLDTKSMRKWELGDTVFASIETVEEGTASMRFQMDSRMLVKLV